MMRTVSVAAVFAGAHAGSIASCGSASDILQNPQFTVSPDPIDRGKEFTITLEGDLKEDYSGGGVDVDLDVKLLDTIDKHVSTGADISFSPVLIPKGNASFVLGPVKLPYLPGSLGANGTVKLANAAGAQIACVQLDLDAPLMETKEDDLAETGPIPTCTKDSDHMKNFTITSGSGAVEISGGLDEDLLKMSVGVDLKIHIGWLPLPFKVNVPFQVSPGLTHGKLDWKFAGRGTESSLSLDKGITVNGKMTLQDGNSEEVMCYQIGSPETATPSPAVEKHAESVLV